MSHIRLCSIWNICIFLGTGRASPAPVPPNILHWQRHFTVQNLEHYTSDITLTREIRILWATTWKQGHSHPPRCHFGCFNSCRLLMEGSALLSFLYSPSFLSSGISTITLLLRAAEVREVKQFVHSGGVDSATAIQTHISSTWGSA